MMIFSAFTTETWKKVSISSLKSKIHGESLFSRFYVGMCQQCVRTTQRNIGKLASLRPNQFSEPDFWKMYQIWPLWEISFSKCPRDENSSFSGWWKIKKIWKSVNKQTDQHQTLSNLNRGLQSKIRRVPGCAALVLGMVDFWIDFEIFFQQAEGLNFPGFKG